MKTTTETVFLMVIAPHPDDSEFGVAGTAARLAKEGKKVVYVICTNGNKGSSDRKMTPEKLIKIREKEQKAAAAVLGVSEVVFLGFGDQELEDNHEFRKEVVRVIRQYKPHVVATADPYRKYMWHRDHRITGIVTADAVYPFARDHMAYPELLEQGYEPHKVKEMWFWSSDDPNFRSDITDTIDLKLEALACHKSQFDVGKEMKDRLTGMAKMSAKGEKFQYAEAFHRVELRG
jgi:LmbE family N-acetylglucosaminyl deacetylase